MKEKANQMHAAVALAKKLGLLRPRDLDEANIPRVVLSRLTANGQLVKLGRGLYSFSDNKLLEDESLAVIALKIPKAVVCLLSALQFHQLTTQLPRDVWIAMPHGSHMPRLEYPPIKMVQFSGPAYTDGIENIKYRNIMVRVYNPAKTVADCFKYRNKIGLDVAIEALRETRAKNRASAEELWHFAKICSHRTKCAAMEKLISIYFITR